ncbi:hypothetical protein EV646_106386 [Kribbella antiqua]|uniref:Uncharacterized protein n=1 Tax=Kribbella antiqua TaxID=2512217 RepID=A0A4R2IRZ3_9ACTN|nr:hypothetical protein EV646_106386 [Kribbella antiqua]
MVGLRIQHQFGFQAAVLEGGEPLFGLAYWAAFVVDRVEDEGGGFDLGSVVVRRLGAEYGGVGPGQAAVDQLHHADADVCGAAEADQIAHASAADRGLSRAYQLSQTGGVVPGVLVEVHDLIQPIAAAPSSERIEKRPALFRCREQRAALQPLISGSPS